MKARQPLSFEVETEICQNAVCHINVSPSDTLAWSSWNVEYGRIGFPFKDLDGGENFLNNTGNPDGTIFFLAN